MLVAGGFLEWVASGFDGVVPAFADAGGEAILVGLTVSALFVGFDSLGFTALAASAFFAFDAANSAAAVLAVCAAAL